MVVEYVIIPLGQLFLLAFGVLGMYLVVKHKSLAFWEKADRKQLMVMKIGFGGFVASALTGIGWILLWGSG